MQFHYGNRTKCCWAIAIGRDSLQLGLRGSRWIQAECIPLPIPHFTGAAEAHHAARSAEAVTYLVGYLDTSDCDHPA
jgi:hypothetical protein